LLSFVNVLEEPCSEWQDSHDITELSALSADFSILFELSDLFFYILYTAASFSSLSITTLLPFIYLALMTFTAVTSTWKQHLRATAASWRQSDVLSYPSPIRSRGFCRGSIRSSCAF
jgi:hypothetical protein